MTLAQRIAGDTMALIAIWLTWVLLAPLISGPVPTPTFHHVCPRPEIVRGVGADLRTYQHRIDRCALPRP